MNNDGERGSQEETLPPKYFSGRVIKKNYCISSLFPSCHFFGILQKQIFLCLVITMNGSSNLYLI